MKVSSMTLYNTEKRKGKCIECKHFNHADSTCHGIKIDLPRVERECTWFELAK